MSEVISIIDLLINVIKGNTKMCRKRHLLICHCVSIVFTYCLTIQHCSDNKKERNISKR